MVIQERNRIIRAVKKEHPELTDEQIGRMFPKNENDKRGLSRQRINTIVRKPENNGIMHTDMANNIDPIKEPISPSKAAMLTGIPKYTITSWAHRGLVTILKNPGRKARGKTMILDPVSLQERIDRYRPRQKKSPVNA